MKQAPGTPVKVIQAASQNLMTGNRDQFLLFALRPPIPGNPNPVNNQLQ